MSAGRGAVAELGTGSSDPTFVGFESLGQSWLAINLEEPRGAYR